MTTFAYLISDDMEDIYFYIKKKKKGQWEQSSPLALTRPGPGE